MSVFFKKQPPQDTNKDKESIWHIMSWMSSHEEYVTVGYVLAEYATKAALTILLPSNKAKRYADVLAMMGFDVDDDAGIGKILKIAMVPASLSIIKTLASQKEKGHALEQALVQHMDIKPTDDAITHIQKRVQNLAEMPPPPSNAHEQFAAYLLQNEHDGVKTIQNKALEIYGGSTWFEVGMACILKRLQNNNNNISQDTMRAWLQQSYDEWGRWGRLHWPDVAKHYYHQRDHPPSHYI